MILSKTKSSLKKQIIGLSLFLFLSMSLSSVSAASQVWQHKGVFDTECDASKNSEVLPEEGSECSTLGEKICQINVQGQYRSTVPWAAVCVDISEYRPSTIYTPTEPAQTVPEPVTTTREAGGEVKETIRKNYRGNSFELERVEWYKNSKDGAEGYAEKGLIGPDYESLENFPGCFEALKSATGPVEQNQTNGCGRSRLIEVGDTWSVKFQKGYMPEIYVNKFPGNDKDFFDIWLSETPNQETSSGSCKRKVVFKAKKQSWLADRQIQNSDQVFCAVSKDEVYLNLKAKKSCEGYDCHINMEAIYYPVEGTKPFSGNPVQSQKSKIYKVLEPDGIFNLAYENVNTILPRCANFRRSEPGESVWVPNCLVASNQELDMKMGMVYSVRMRFRDGLPGEPFLFGAINMGEAWDNLGGKRAVLSEKAGDFTGDFNPACELRSGRGKITVADQATIKYRREQQNNRRIGALTNMTGYDINWDRCVVESGKDYYLNFLCEWPYNSRTVNRNGCNPYITIGASGGRVESPYDFDGLYATENAIKKVQVPLVANGSEVEEDKIPEINPQSSCIQLGTDGKPVGDLPEPYTDWITNTGPEVLETTINGVEIEIDAYYRAGFIKLCNGDDYLVQEYWPDQDFITGNIRTEAGGGSIVRAPQDPVLIQNIPTSGNVWQHKGVFDTECEASKNTEILPQEGSKCVHLGEKLCQINAQGNYRSTVPWAAVCVDVSEYRPSGV